VLLVHREKGIEGRVFFFVEKEHARVNGVVALLVRLLGRVKVGKAVGAEGRVRRRHEKVVLDPF